MMNVSNNARIVDGDVAARKRNFPCNAIVAQQLKRRSRRPSGTLAAGVSSTGPGKPSPTA